MTEDVKPGTPGEAGGSDERPAADSPPVEVLDCRGQRCPLPVIALAKHLPGRPAGTVVRVLADDPAAANDIPAWCRMRGYEFLGSPEPDSYDVGSPPGSGPRGTGASTG